MLACTRHHGILVISSG